MTVDARKVGQLMELAAYWPVPMSQPTEVLTSAHPPAGEPHPPRQLTIGMATYDDYDGVYFTVQALRMYHADVMDRVSILVLDNNPTGPAAWPLKSLEQRAPQVRYVPVDGVQGTGVRDLVFRHATSEFVMCIDSHVLIAPGALARLLAFLDANPDCDDLLQGPIQWDELGDHVATHFDPTWRAGMYGTWAVDERGKNADAAPFEIGMQGLGCFVARRKSWPGFNPRFRGFGGEEGYVHEKYRRQGHRVLCLPFLRWMHRFDRPLGQQYPNRWDDRVRNYLIGWSELGLDEQVVIDHFTEAIGAETTERVVASLAEERANPFSYFDAIYCINLDSETERWEKMQARFEHLGIASAVRRFRAIETAGDHHIGCALSHRAIIEAARLEQLENVLVFEDDAVFLEGARWCLRRSVAELQEQKWDLCYLGGCRWGRPSPKAPGCEHLEIPEVITCTHAIAYNRRIFDRILADIPPTVDGVRAWCKDHAAIDQYLTYDLRDERRFLTAPAIATQPAILRHESEDSRDAYTT